MNNSRVSPAGASRALGLLLDELGLPRDQTEEVATLLGLAVSLAMHQSGGPEVAGGGLADLVGRLARIEDQQWRMHRQHAAALAAIGRVTEQHCRATRWMAALVAVLACLNAAMLARLCLG